ncbi:beta-1,3-galactosyltransferase 5 [Aplysia californica]|uniref:Hexosyltransferase n=1 Tax=Aplysia californica TaxID=6500 RepID=A0ABM1AE24_APLCA|nr:beta-1,3-galactosyltransferase 5 [Aplysia californica]
MESNDAQKRYQITGQNGFISCIMSCNVTATDTDDSRKAACVHRCQAAQTGFETHDIDSHLRTPSPFDTSELPDTSGIDPGLTSYLKRNIQREIDRRNAVLTLLTSPVINAREYTYLHNVPDLCQRSETIILFVIPSALTNFGKRARVRSNNYARFVKDTQNKAKMAFFVGMVPASFNDTYRYQVQKRIDMEFAQFGDIIQADYEDEYSNMWYKTQSVLKWVTSYCGSVQYVIRTDDDIQIHTHRVLAALFFAEGHHDHFVMGVRRRNSKPQRIDTGKWYISLEEYPEEFFPPFVIGGLVGLPGRTAKLLYEASRRVSKIWLDDVYFTGILTHKLNLPVLSDPDFTFAHFPKGNKRRVPQTF